MIFLQNAVKLGLCLFICLHIFAGTPGSHIRVCELDSQPPRLKTFYARQEAPQPTGSLVS